MILKTKYHGEIEYGEEDIVEFSKGILGFEHLKKFIISPLKDNEVFQLMHSIEDISIGFVVSSPFLVNKHYEFKLNDNIIKDLNISSPQEVLVLNILTINSDIRKTTINLRAPVIINIKTKLGVQTILGNEEYNIKTPILGE